MEISEKNSNTTPDEILDVALQETDTDLWQTFVSARTEGEFYQYWLELQSKIISGVTSSLLVVDKGDGEFSPVAGWPRGGTDFAELGSVVERVIEEGCGLLVELGKDNHFGAAYPLMVDARLQGVVALEIHASFENDLKEGMEALQWGTGWLELLIRRKQVKDNEAVLHRLKNSVDLFAITLGKESFAAAATAFATELAMATKCERVSLGIANGTKVNLMSVSYSADVDQKMNLTKAIEAAMEEAIFQRCEIVFPQVTDELVINRAHETLSRQQAMAVIATFPLYKDGDYYGCITCERSGDNSFSEDDIEFFRAVAALAGPALEAKYVNDRPLPVKAKKAAQSQLKRVFGSGYYGRKLVLLIVTLLVLFFSFAKGDYRLPADIVLEGEMRRSIVVPFDGFVDQAIVRAGDLVEQGDILCRLDDRDLRLLNLAKKSEHRQLQRQYQSATAKHDRAQSKIIRAQLDQAQAEIDLVEEKLSRTALHTPFAGLVVSGDLSQRLGSAVKQGDVLFEITPLDSYRVILKVDERRINDVKVNQAGALVLSSLPQQKFDFTVTRITPVAKAEEGRNYFRVEASLARNDDSLRPGMEGVGKINIDKRRLISIWTRDMVEWLKLFWWSWFA